MGATPEATEGRLRGLHRLRLPEHAMQQSAGLAVFFCSVEKLTLRKNKAAKGYVKKLGCDP